MNYALKPIALAMLLAASQLAGVAYAEASKTASAISGVQASAAVKEDQAQLNADKAAWRSERKQFNADEAKLKADAREGRMAAESKDAETIYHDQQFIKGEKKDIAADKPGSLQKKFDITALKKEQTKLQIDKATLKRDTAEGNMAAESKDAERVDQDRQYIKGEKKDIASDLAKLKAAERQSAGAA